MIDVRFDDVSKRYQLRQRRGGSGPSTTDFWAVRSVSFDVPHGETLGIIGRNGAGKSTLLKLLSRITSPTSGTITLEGRVAALIEVGSGFHPELTGRENVFLSGAVLGMKRREIARKLDRILEFSGVGQYADMPVKWYSSGMYVRLGFAVAAHLEADILLVDEVLAVGDAAFQLQCYDRIDELRHAGTTMLFISHDLSSVERLCDRVILLNKGQVIAAGSPRQVIADYQEIVTNPQAEVTAGVRGTADAAGARITGVRFADEQGADVLSTRTGDPLRTRVEIDITSPFTNALVEVFYYSRDGSTLHCQQSTALGGEMFDLTPGRREIEFSCDAIGLQPGIYAIGASLKSRGGATTVDWWYGSKFLYVEPGKSVRGYFYAPHEWRWIDAGTQAERRPADV